MEVVGIETATPNSLQINDIIIYYYIAKIVNETSLMAQFALNLSFFELFF